MNPLYAIYTVLVSGIFISAFPFFWLYSGLTGRYRKGFKERLGLLPQGLAQHLAGSPRIWIHAVSLGEVKVAAPIIGSLKKVLPDSSIIVSSTTDHGIDLARQIFGKEVLVLYAPIDTIFSIRKALSGLRPDLMLFLETEIWPAWITEARRAGIKIALINGRISVRSIGKYLKFKPFFRDLLRQVDVFSMISQEDADRVQALGAEPRKIEVNGNAKYDLLATQADPAMEREMRRILNLEPAHPVFIAGSTRSGEEEMVLDAYEKIIEEFPDMVLIIAPRHIERTPEIESIIKSRRLGYQLRSELDGNVLKRTKPVVIMNTFGELFKVYSVGTIVFCGASLVPLGGQNPLEAAVWGKVVFYGPSMEDFLDAKALLEEMGAGITVSSSEMLAEKALWFLSHPDDMNTLGRKSKEAAMKNQKASEKHANVIARMV
ncbi:MAG: 3-deoxy-D-manno-octulosonic acid transferase [Deltaproteobacteria bacterium]|nr:3-deoxy-D-manno-octulosonic acid transferase [Deltaproteobacteria bacterium]